MPCGVFCEDSSARASGEPNPFGLGRFKQVIQAGFSRVRDQNLLVGFEEGVESLPVISDDRRATGGGSRKST